MKGKLRFTQLMPFCSHCWFLFIYLFIYLLLLLFLVILLALMIAGYVMLISSVGVWLK